jgi:UDP-N-acetylglucosamine:LPS N-acetylglucosamine transferase
MSRVSRCDVLAISSSGGHWVEMARLFPAFNGYSVEYACTDAGRAADAPLGRFHVLIDANKQTPWRLIVCFFQVVRLVFHTRPRVIISTGAAPGLIAIVCGKLIGARAVWLDIFGLVERMTLSGRMVKPFADVYLVQWPHLAKPDGPQFRGSLL